MRIPSPIQRPHQNGSALLAVLALLAIISIAFMTTLRIITFNSKMAGSKLHSLKALQAAEKGIAIASIASIKRSDPLLQQSDSETGDSFHTILTTEGARFNINYIIFKQDKELLKHIFATWGADADTAAQVTDALFDWIDTNDEVSINGAESKQYEALGRYGQPYNHPFYSLDEMRLVLGMDKIEALKPNWKNYFTIYSNGPIDLNEANAELISLACDVPIETANIIPQTVRGADQLLGTTDDQPFNDTNQALQTLGSDNSNPLFLSRCGINDATTRIESTGQSGDIKRRINLVLRNRSSRPTILERTEEIIP